MNVLFLHITCLVYCILYGAAKIPRRRNRAAVIMVQLFDNKSASSSSHISTDLDYMVIFNVLPTD